MSKITFLVLLTLFFSAIWAGETNYFSASNVKLFADYLYNEEDFERAAGEYQRLLLLTSDENPEILYKTGICFQKAGKYNTADKYYDELIAKSKSPIVEAARYQKALNLKENSKYTESYNYLEENSAAFTTEKGIIFRECLLGINELQDRNWQQAETRFSLLAEQHKAGNYSGKIKRLHSLAEEGLALRYKSIWKAGLLSTFVPGLGKVYSGRKVDGIHSFITVGLFLWQGYNGFNEDGLDSVRGWIYGSLGTVFYLGNIYGSIVAVKVHNESLELEILRKIDFDLYWNLE